MEFGTPVLWARSNRIDKCAFLHEKCHISPAMPLPHFLSVLIYIFQLTVHYVSFLSPAFKSCLWISWDSWNFLILAGLPAEGRHKEGFDMRVCQPRVTGGWCGVEADLWALFRASWDTLPLPLHRLAAHGRSPEKLTSLNKGVYLPLSDFQPFP